MKKCLIVLLGTLLALTAHGASDSVFDLLPKSSPTPAEKKKSGGSSRKKATANSKSSEIADETKSRAIASTVVLRTPTGGGSGFVVEDDGQKFIVTNQHVLLGTTQEELEIVTTQGKRLTPVALEIVSGADLARISVAEAPASLSFATSANVDDAVATVGNSLDAGVITLNAGTIKGIGASELEVDCEVVPGQSGGPLINKEGDVLGVTTYILLADKDKTSEGTRYAQKRYFTVRIGTETEWTPVSSWADYARIGLIVQKGDEVYEEALDLALSADDGPDGDYNYKGDNPKLIAAANQHNRFAAKMTRMDGDVVTSSELKRNNASLATNFRGVYKALIEACKEAETAVQREINSGRPKRYPWLAEQADETAARLSSLARSLESRSKARPSFLSW